MLPPSSAESVSSLYCSFLFLCSLRFCIIGSSQTNSLKAHRKVRLRRINFDDGGYCRGTENGTSLISPRFRRVAAGLIVISCLCDDDRVFIDLVDETMFVIDTPRPVARQGVSQRLWLSRSLEWCAGDFFDQTIDPFEHLAVGSLPMEIVVPRLAGEDDLHWTSFRSLPLPASSSPSEARRRRAFFGLFKR